MSDAKFAAARELIREKHYEEARVILKTIDDPKATSWLKRIDEITGEKTVTSSRPKTTSRTKATSHEAEEYYQAQNKKRRRRKLGNGIELTFMGIIVCAIAIGMSAPTIGGVPQPGSSNPLNGVLLLAGILCILAGLTTIARRKKI